jgi:hypothetical protein
MARVFNIDLRGDKEKDSKYVWIDQSTCISWQKCLLLPQMMNS